MRLITLSALLTGLAACKGQPTPAPTAPNCTIGFADRDGDGFGNPNLRTSDCQEPVVDNDLDCDDLFNTAFPGAIEICDGVDNDCDGMVDGDDSELDIEPQYLDADGDGIGAGPPVAACDPLEGHVALDGDCDDANPDVSPIAPEVCDEVDNNCDGEIDDADLDDFDYGSAPSWFIDSDGDGFAGPVQIAACEMPPGAATDWDDCNDANPLAFPGAQEVCNGLDDDCDGADDTAGPCEFHQGEWSGPFTLVLSGPSTATCTGTIAFDVLWFDTPPLRGDVTCTFDVAGDWALDQTGTIDGVSYVDDTADGTLTLFGSDAYGWDGTIGADLATGTATGLYISGGQTWDLEATWTATEPVPPPLP